jgi:hypothetical protein
MEEMAVRYAPRSVRSVFIYTREAHPGERCRHHTSMADKRRNARDFKTEFKVKRQILLDDLDGTVHRAYGMLPNMSWIVGRGGLILYKAAWTDPSDIEDALKYSLDAMGHKNKDKLMPYYSERLRWRLRDDEKFRARLAKNGPQAVRDFYGSILDTTSARPQEE